MNHELKRLLFIAQPFHDESFVGYIMRLSEMNGIPEIRWILRLVGLKKLYDYTYKFRSDFRIDTKILSSISGVNESIIENLLYKHEFGRTRHITGNILVLGAPVPHRFVRRENPKICPGCLRERNYLRKIWEILFITACPIHQCLLLDNCLNCLNKIGWKRTKISVCRCGFDFREYEDLPVDANELRLAKYFYQEFSLSHRNQNISFDYPLNTLKLENLLELILFIATHYAGEFSGSDISLKFNNAELHRFLNKGIQMFDNWAVNYYKFIEWWKAQNKQYYISRLQVYSPRNRLDGKYSEFELFNYVLNYYLDDKKLGFMHEEFKTFLESLSSADFKFNF
jgi:hypothetical protein